MKSARKSRTFGKWLCGLSLAFGLFTSLSCAAERRVAFVVGNGDYQSVPHLPNPSNDAAAVAEALLRSGFEVVSAIDLDRASLDAATLRFARSLEGASISVFYYSGHGVEVNGDNRIIPVDATLKAPADLEVQTISIQTIMRYMQSNSKAQIIYLDACRDNPFPKTAFLLSGDNGLAKAGLGLAAQEGGKGSLIAFSTQPGEVAQDGEGKNSPFTEAVLKHSFNVGIDVQTSLMQVTQDVWTATHKKQRPWANSTLIQPVVLNIPKISAKLQEATRTIAVAETESIVATEPSKILTLPSHEVPIGVGPISIVDALPPSNIPGDAVVKLATAPTSGVLYLNDAPLAVGSSLAWNEFSGLKFDPLLGSENADISFTFQTAAAEGVTPVALNGKIVPKSVACDNAAGEPLDLQGAAIGKLPNEIDTDSALTACQQAVSDYPGVARFQYQLGRVALAAKKTDVANKLFELAADGKHIRALYQLGYMYQRGLGKPQDLQKANDYFKQGAEQGDPYAMLSYGRNLVRGRGIEANVDEGLTYLNRAVELGHTYAMNELGALYYYGKPLKQNQKRGIRFYEASMARGDIYAIRNMALVYQDGRGVEQDLDTALALFKKASAGGHPDAPTDIGAMYYKGMGVKKSLGEAIKWYALGAERGSRAAASNLGWIYSQGPDSTRDMAKAVWFTALAIGLDTYNANPKEISNLEAFPDAAKSQAVKDLIAFIGAENAETTDDLNGTLVLLARKAWQKRNPRLDLF